MLPLKRGHHTRLRCRRCRKFFIYEYQGGRKRLSCDPCLPLEKADAMAYFNSLRPTKDKVPSWRRAPEARAIAVTGRREGSNARPA